MATGDAGTGRYRGTSPPRSPVAMPLPPFARPPPGPSYLTTCPSATPSSLTAPSPSAALLSPKTRPGPVRRRPLVRLIPGYRTSLASHPLPPALPATTGCPNRRRAVVGNPVGLGRVGGSGWEARLVRYPGISRTLKGTLPSWAGARLPGERCRGGDSGREVEGRIPSRRPSTTLPALRFTIVRGNGPGRPMPL